MPDRAIIHCHPTHAPNQRDQSPHTAQPFILSSIPKPHTSLEGVRFNGRPTHHSLPSNTCPKSTGSKSPHCPTVHLVKHTEPHTSLEGVRFNARAEPSITDQPTHAPNQRDQSPHTAQPFILSRTPKPHTSLEGVRFNAGKSNYSLPSNACPESPGTKSPNCPTIHLVQHTKASYFP